MKPTTRRIFDATSGRVMAFTYDRVMDRAQRRGLTELRARTLAPATGRTLEIGAGTGLNLSLYPATVTELVLSEPFEPMAAQARTRIEAERSAQAAGSAATVATLIGADAEALPFDDGHFDTVIGTLVLCTIENPAAALAEVRRVLRPGGNFLFCEHVRSADRRRARFQDLLHGPWFVCGHGCHCNRDTAATIRASGLELAELTTTELPALPPIARELIIGIAVRPANDDPGLADPLGVAPKQ